MEHRRVHRGGPRPDQAADHARGAGDYNEKLTKVAADGSIERAGFIPYYPGKNFNEISHLFGCEYYDKATNKLTVNSDACVQFFDWYKAYAQKYDKNGKITDLIASKGSEDEDLFYTGKVAMGIFGEWVPGAAYAPTFAPNLKYDSAPIPAKIAANYGAGFINGNAFFIPKGSKDPEAAAKFGMYLMTDPTRRKKMAIQNASVPQLTSLMADPRADGGPAFQGVPRHREHQEHLVQPDDLSWAELNDWLDTALDEVITGGADPQQTLTTSRRRSRRRSTRAGRSWCRRLRGAAGLRPVAPARTGGPRSMTCWWTRTAVGLRIGGHRGAASVAPENTLAGVRRAIELGVDYVELDVHLARGRRAGRYPRRGSRAHDGRQRAGWTRSQPTSCGRSTRDVVRAGLRGRAGPPAGGRPRAAAAASAGGRPVGAVLEAKGPGTGGPLGAVRSRAPRLRDRLAICSFDPTELRAARVAEPTIPTMLIVDRDRPDDDPVEVARACERLDRQRPAAWLEAADVDRLHAAGLLVAGGTGRTHEAIDPACHPIGLDAVDSNDPGRAVGWRAAWGGATAARLTAIDRAILLIGSGEPDWAPTDPLDSQVYLVTTDDGHVVVDAGAGPERRCDAWPRPARRGRPGARPAGSC